MRKVSAISALVYMGLSTLAAGLFLAITLAGDYSWVARLGGSAWIFLLSNIVLMPVVIPAVKKRLGA
ncbi:MAG: hypothetical protein HW388_455 [Dehalococcoidia bacterium]|nr:hypothetical protein [Dehalococcoidia bacterium]